MDPVSIKKLRRGMYLIRHLTFRSKLLAGTPQWEGKVIGELMLLSDGSFFGARIYIGCEMIYNGWRFSIDVPLSCRKKIKKLVNHIFVVEMEKKIDDYDRRKESEKYVRAKEKEIISKQKEARKRTISSTCKGKL